LGVLCDLYSKQTNTPWDKTGPGEFHSGRYLMHANSSQLPVEVQEWAGLKGVNSHNPDIGNSNLIGLNDNGKSFEGIAEAIETYL